MEETTRKEEDSELGKLKPPILNCPVCGAIGESVPNNKVVLKHTFQEKKYLAEHKWSINSGRMFSKKSSDDDEIW